jgi:Flp pilus assembly protein TadD
MTSSLGRLSACFRVALAVGLAILVTSGCDHQQPEAKATPPSSTSALSGTNLPPPPTPAVTSGTAPLPERTDTDELANQYILDAQSLADTKNWTAALELYRKASTLSPKNEDLHFRMGVCHAALGQQDQAEREYREAIRLFPDFPEAHNNLGSLLVRQGHLEEGLSHLHTAIAGNPQNPKAHNNLGMALAKQGDLASAITEFEEASRLDPRSAEVWVNLANAYMLQRRYAEARVPLDTALRLDPQFAPALKARDRLESRSGVNH